MRGGLGGVQSGQRGWGGQGALGGPGGLQGGLVGWDVLGSQRGVQGGQGRWAGQGTLSAPVGFKLVQGVGVVCVLQVTKEEY